MAMSIDQQTELLKKLEKAIVACNERCLYFAAKWTAELLNSMDDADADADADAQDDPKANNDNSDTEVDDDEEASSTPLSRATGDKREARLEKKELPRYLMAKSFFDCREFDRCASVFLPHQVPYTTPTASVLSPTATGPGAQQQHTPGKNRWQRPTSLSGPVKPAQQRAPLSPKNLSQKSLFLALYARYLAGEKRKNENSETILGPHDGPSLVNKEVAGISTILEDYFNARGGMQDLSNSQGWLDYLYGIVLVKMKSESLARQWLLRSVNINPHNWAAWLELASLVESPENLQEISQYLPQDIMTFFFHIHCNQELFQQEKSVYDVLAQLQTIFPRSAYLQQQRALLLYHARHQEEAVEIFDNLIRSHPHRLDGMEIYSNLLYVLQNRPKLATLAAMASETDKFRPETNCILGNYYSLIGEHEKAVLHFRRALQLDRNCQTAWTLMGHEYIELKNTQAAIESYRRAVDTNRKDYRAWYGLGQGYEMLECHSYSLFYYKRAASLCVADPKMWAAVGNAYSKCGKITNAISALKRALIVGSQMDTGASFGSSASDPLAHAVGGALDPQILYDIALLYEKESSFEEASAYMELALAQEDGADEGEEGIGVTQITSRARLWLARYCHSQSDWQRTMQLANELIQDSVEVEEAKSLVNDVRSRLTLAEQAEG